MDAADESAQFYNLGDDTTKNEGTNVVAPSKEISEVDFQVANRIIEDFKSRDHPE